MPTMDMSEVLSEPMFQDSFQVTVVIGTVNQQGMETDALDPEPDDATGIVIPGRTSLNRAADGSRLTAFIDIFTQYRLSPGTKTNDTTHKDADIVLWHGRQYTVMSVEDYTAFGAGWVKASADLIELNPSV